MAAAGKMTNQGLVCPLAPRQQGRTLVEHVAPARRRRCHREPEEGQRALQDDDGGDGDEPEGHDGRHDVGQDLAGEDPGVAGAERLGGQHEVPGGVGQGRGPDHAEDQRRGEEADDQRDLEQRLAPEGHDGDDGHDGGEGQHHVGAGVEERVDPPPPVGRDHGGDAADEQADERPAEADDQGDPRPVDQAAEDVPVEVVGAEEMAPARSRVLHAAVVAQVRVGQREEVGEGGRQRDQDDPARADPEEHAELLLGRVGRRFGLDLLLDVGEGLVGRVGQADATHGQSSGRRW